jgi:chorismate synthase
MNIKSLISKLFRKQSQHEIWSADYFDYRDVEWGIHSVYSDKKTAEKMLEQIALAAKNNDSVGGVVSCVIKGVPVGIGEPIYDKLQARLAYAMLSIPAAKGFDYGCGFNSAQMFGSEMNDIFVSENQQIKTATNNCGGILGGISTGNDIFFRVAFKSVSSIGKTQQTVDIQGNTQYIAIKGRGVDIPFLKEMEYLKKETQAIVLKGRHDVCVLPRAISVVEAMAALVVLDFVV